MRSSMQDLQKGLNGELNMSEGMEHLLEAMSINQVPGRNVFHRTSWEKHAWWSNKTLATWYVYFICLLICFVDRIQEMFFAVLMFFVI